MTEELSKPKRKDLDKNDPLRSNPERRRLNIEAFTMYCRGMQPMDIAEQLGIQKNQISFWVTAQKWTKCRARLALGDKPSGEPWNMDGVPDTLELAVELMEVQSKAIKWLNTRTIAKAAEFANDFTPEEAFKNIKLIKALTEANKNVFGEVNGPFGGIHVTIGQVIHSIKIPEEKKAFGVTLELEE